LKELAYEVKITKFMFQFEGVTFEVKITKFMFQFEGVTFEVKITKFMFLTQQTGRLPRKANQVATMPKPWQKWQRRALVKW
jgi:hypothetical protein